MRMMFGFAAAADERLQRRPKRATRRVRRWRDFMRG
jgi:hypothetical protein